MPASGAASSSRGASPPRRQGEKREQTTPEPSPGKKKKDKKVLMNQEMIQNQDMNLKENQEDLKKLKNHHNNHLRLHHLDLQRRSQKQNNQREKILNMQQI